MASSSAAAPAARRPIPISQSTDSYFVAARRIQPPSLALASARILALLHDHLQLCAHARGLGCERGALWRAASCATCACLERVQFADELVPL